jgi:polyisoprenoid-binding protein YceI
MVAVSLLAACGAPQPRPGTLGGAVSTDVQAAPRGAGVYRIDAAQSELELLVYRAGPLARLGHNHVIVNRAVTGWVRFAGDATSASFALDVPVAEFIIDDADARREEGADFSDPVPADAKDGTRHNLLSDALLNGEHYPVIHVASTSVTKTADGLAATVRVSVAGHDSTLVMPFSLQAAPGRLNASGTGTLRQTALGLTPFSVLLGALQVRDEFTVKFRWVAVSP